MSYLIGVDVGTTSVKCGLFDLDGNIISLSTREYSLLTPKPDYVELDPDVYWNVMVSAIRDVLQKSKISAKEVLSIGISSQGETLIVLDKNGVPLRPAIVWLDNRSKSEAKILKEKFEEIAFNITGQPEIVPTWPATKILWLRNNEKSVFEKAKMFLMVEDYLIYKLTGEFVTEYSVCSSTLYFDIVNDSWWEDMLSEIGITQDQLPTLKASGEIVGNITSEAAEQTGLSKETIVATGAMDQAASAIGAGNVRPGVVSENTGAALAVVATIDKPVYDEKRRIPCHRHAIDKLYFLMPWCQTAGMFLKWFRDTFCHIEKSLEPLLGRDAYEIMDLEALRVPPGCEGLVMLPHLTGAACPEFDPYAKCVMFGITLKHTKPYFIRAVMESISYMLRRNVELLRELGIPIHEIRSIGGAAKSGLWLQIKSDVLQKEILVPRIKDTAVLGAAILAGIATGVYSSVESAVRSMVKIEKIIKPRKEFSTLYDKLYEIYVELYEVLRPLFRRVEVL